MYSHNVFCLVYMYEKINGSVEDECQVVTGLSTAEDWTWPVSGLHPAGGPRTLGGQRRGNAGRPDYRRCRGWSWSVSGDCRVF